jgi:Ca-activated chloride channel family protein
METFEMPTDKPRHIKLSITVLALAALLLSACGPGEIESRDEAVEQLEKLVSDTVKPSRRENTRRANIQLSKTNLLSMLPGIGEYPMTLDARDSGNVEAVEIFTSSEKAGQGRDGFYLELARQFNQQGYEISNGKRAQIGIRKIASGLGAQFILARRHLPDAFSPSNHLWGDMLQAQGIPLTTMAEVTAPNTAGVIVRSSKKSLITTDGKLDVQKLLTAVTGGSFAMGYTNPYQSSTGLNFLLTVLDAFSQQDETQFLAPDVSSAFEAFQAGIPFVAQTTLQMRDAAVDSGVLDALVMENQSWVNVTGMGDYEFVPFGVRHDSPLYATEEADADEREVLALFVEFIEQNQRAASEFGFGGLPDYESGYRIENGATILGAQKIWKEKKSGGKPIAAVFVADVSGSMDGMRLKNLKKALIESSDLISSTNAIGLVSYNESVNVDLNIRPFNIQQKALFIGAVEDLSAGGNTATNNAVLVAAKELLAYSRDHSDHKLVVFVLSDGETNKGLEYQSIATLMEWTGIPIHAIAYELSSDHLKAMAGLAEGAYIESSAESASYRIGNLLNSEM